MAGMLAIGSASIAEMFSLRRGPFPRRNNAERSGHAGPEQAGIDRIADHEEAAERQRQAADPHHPAGADAFLEAGLGLRQRRGYWSRAASGLSWRGSFCGRRGGWCVRNGGRFFDRNGWRGDCEGLIEFLKRYSSRLQSRRLDRVQPGTQRARLVERLAREEERDDGNRERKEVHDRIEVRRQIEHRASQAIGPMSRAYRVKNPSPAVR